MVNDKRVERNWRRKGLRVPAKQPKKGRLWLADGCCMRLRIDYPNHVWSYDFVEDRTHKSLAIRIDRRLTSIDVIDVRSDLFTLRGVPVQTWITAVGAKIAYITTGSLWENGLIESFNARLRDELLDVEIFYWLAEGKIVIESWRRHDNTVRLQGSLGCKPPVPKVFVPAMATRAASKPHPLASQTPPALASRPSMH